jgi:hypothetical protein
MVERLWNLFRCRLWHNWRPHGTTYGTIRECQDCGRREELCWDAGGWTTGYWERLD